VADLKSEFDKLNKRGGACEYDLARWCLKVVEAFPEHEEFVMFHRDVLKLPSRARKHRFMAEALNVVPLKSTWEAIGWTGVQRIMRAPEPASLAKSVARKLASASDDPAEARCRALAVISVAVPRQAPRLRNAAQPADDGSARDLATLRAALRRLVNGGCGFLVGMLTDEERRAADLSTAAGRSRQAV